MCSSDLDPQKDMNAKDAKDVKNKENSCLIGCYRKVIHRVSLKIFKIIFLNCKMKILLLRIILPLLYVHRLSPYRHHGLLLQGFHSFPYIRHLLPYLF